MKEVRDGIIEAQVIDDMIKYFSAQVILSSIVLGLKFSSWILFGIALLIPSAVFILSGKFKICRILSVGLCFVYIIIWGYTGFLIGKIFSVSASIVLCILFLIPGVCWNWWAFTYFSEK